jgi:hypothetical protein
MVLQGSCRTHSEQNAASKLGFSPFNIHEIRAIRAIRFIKQALFESFAHFAVKETQRIF